MQTFSITGNKFLKFQTTVFPEEKAIATVRNHQEKAKNDLHTLQFFIWYASGPGIPPKLSIFERRQTIFLRMQIQDSKTITFQAAVRCCVTATLASETF